MTPLRSVIAAVLFLVVAVLGCYDAADQDEVVIPVPSVIDVQAARRESSATTRPVSGRPRHVVAVIHDRAPPFPPVS